uniref:Uncharacterized protein n=1 Tax=Tanacetum cinerariifolium TaxID=118510 RepID=A0A699IFQ4_TANCI|nr:hypothetical protein [Tanacetum cinerariifolium]
MIVLLRELMIMLSQIGNPMASMSISFVNSSGPASYAKLVTGEPSRKSVNFCILLAPAGNGPDVAISLESVWAASEHFANHAYSFFLEKCVAYPVVENYFIRSTPLILKKWNPDANLLKEDVCNVPIWVKIHGVPITEFSEDRLSDTTTKLGIPLVIDFYTSAMCTESWDRSSYARAMIELRVNVELKDTIMVVVLKLASEGFSMCTIRIAYEWKPPRCSTCKVFGHDPDDCPKRIMSDVLKNLKNPRQIVRGVQVYPVNSDSDSEVENVFNETAGFMASTSLKADNSKSGNGAESKNMYEKWRETYDEYVYDDDFDDYGLTDVALKFANTFDINLRSQLR